MKKWIGGAKKHGGLFSAMEKQMDSWGRDLDKSLGKPSGVNSSIPEKRKESENNLKDVAHELTGGLAYPGRGENEGDESVGVIEEVVEEKELVLDVHIIDISKENLRAAVLEYIDHDSVDEEVAEAITILTAKKSLSNAEVASKVLSFGDVDINSQVKAWVLNHVDAELTINKLKLPAALYFVKHSDRDVAAVIKDAGDNVVEFAAALSH